MLTYLSVKAYGVIEDMAVELGAGLNVISGMSGAGKSMMVNAVKDAFAERVDKSCIRNGAEKAQILLEFDVPRNHPVWVFLSGLALSDPFAIADDATHMSLVVMRSIPKKGASRARVNGMPISARDLSALGAYIFDFYGQHGFMRMFAAHFAREMLDMRVTPALIDDVVARYSDFVEAKSKYDAFVEGLNRQKTERERSVFYLSRLDLLSPEAGEFEALSERLKFLRNGEKMAHLCGEARAFIDKSDVLANFAGAQRQISRLENVEGARTNESFVRNLANVLAALERSMLEIQEFEDALDILADDCVFNADELERIEARYRAFLDTAAQTGHAAENLVNLWVSLKNDAEAYMQSDIDEAGLLKAVMRTQKAWQDAAQALSEARHEVAITLSDIVNVELASLHMQDIRLKFICDNMGADRLPEPSGCDVVTIGMKHFDDVDYRDIRQVASGGELSRISLAFAQLEISQAMCKIPLFDEIDHGVNGVVASKIGEKLLKISRDRQVIAVTHSPQIAAYADTQISVRRSRETGHGANTAHVSVLSGAMRVEEIAALLSGKSVTPEARAAAKRLLEAA